MANKSKRNKKYNPRKMTNSLNKAIMVNHLNDLIYEADGSKLNQKDVDDMLKPIKMVLSKFELANASNIEYNILAENCFNCICCIETFKNCDYNLLNINDITILRLEASVDLDHIHNDIDPIIDSVLERSKKNKNKLYLTLDEIEKIKNIFIPIYSKYMSYLTVGLLFRTIKRSRIMLYDEPNLSSKFKRYKVGGITQNPKTNYKLIN